MNRDTIGLIADIGLWITIITLLTFSVANIAVIIERIIYFRRNATGNPYELILLLRERLLEGKSGEASDLLRGKKSPSARILEAGVKYIHSRGSKQTEILPLELNLDNALAHERIKMDRYLWVLGTIGAIGPLVGLFGTVLGIMRSFAEIAMRGNSGLGVVEVAAGGIWESLYTTAFGILVAVPALIAFNYFTRKARNETELQENCANEIVAVAAELNGDRK